MSQFPEMLKGVILLLTDSHWQATPPTLNVTNVREGHLRQTQPAVTAIHVTDSTPWLLHAQ